MSKRVPKTSAESVCAQPVLLTVFIDLGHQMRKRVWAVKADMAPAKYEERNTQVNCSGNSAGQFSLLMRLELSSV